MKAKTALQAKLAKLPKRYTKAIWDRLKGARQALKDGDIKRAKLLIMVARDLMKMAVELPIRIVANKYTTTAAKTSTGYLVTVQLTPHIFTRITAKSVRDFERQLKAERLKLAG